MSVHGGVCGVGVTQGQAWMCVQEHSGVEWVGFAVGREKGGVGVWKTHYTTTSDSS